ncbi:unnamed protein product [Dovyalis caffra]|uniref:Uncharacterized protein n=1 Tax=Dovyalis caffra TaxID=77055 RepID=A0AAV1RVC2_9ROSI|nr:unnamed protein product [Dovyalis caffra]
MATIKIAIALVLISLLFLVALAYASNAKSLKSCGFDAIYQLGDSTSDTGNLIQEKPSSVCAQFPYGETFFNKSTGRCSNGMLMIDFIARSAGVPFLDAYLNPSGNFTSGHGVNFAVAGSTALPANVLAEKKILPLTNSSLSFQLDWMFSHFNSICFNEQDCVEKLKNSLFIVGEIGGNDYDYAYLQGKTMEEVKHLVPDVVLAIKDAVTRVIGYGARRVIVPGIFPIGCSPIHLTGFQNNNTDAYDKFHCLKGLNNFSAYHNDHLKQAIEELKKEHPKVAIAYADHYNAFQWILSHVSSLGFDAKSVQKACCGTGGDYGFNLKKLCGAPGVPNSCDAIDDVPKLEQCRLNAIYNFGASLSDTGNQIIEIPQVWHTKLPYGQTIHNPTGRASDGLLIIDYIAKSAGLPFLEPYLKHQDATNGGVNFAVGGSTILSTKFLAENNISNLFVKSPLDVQLQWLEKYLKGYCHDAKDCQEKLASSLFTTFAGGNDYIKAFKQNKTIDEVKKVLVPACVEGLKHAVEKFIDLGARRVLVNGLSQSGCTPVLLTKFSSNNSADAYDRFGCLKSYNDLYIYHNDLLREGIEELKKEYPNVDIVYGDLYSAMQWILDNFQQLGFKSLTKACCGAPSKYNYIDNPMKACGAPNATVCDKPQEYIFWDEIHFTQNANEHLANWLLRDIFPKFHCNKACQS